MTDLGLNNNTKLDTRQPFTRLMHFNRAVTARLSPESQATKPDAGVEMASLVSDIIRNNLLFILLK